MQTITSLLLNNNSLNNSTSSNNSSHFNNTFNVLDPTTSSQNISNEEVRRIRAHYFNTTNNNTTNNININTENSIVDSVPNYNNLSHPTVSNPNGLNAINVENIDNNTLYTQLIEGVNSNSNQRLHDTFGSNLNFPLNEHLERLVNFSQFPYQENQINSFRESMLQQIYYNQNVLSLSDVTNTINNQFESLVNTSLTHYFMNYSEQQLLYFYATLADNRFILTLTFLLIFRLILVSILSRSNWQYISISSLRIRLLRVLDYTVRIIRSNSNINLIRQNSLNNIQHIHNNHILESNQAAERHQNWLSSLQARIRRSNLMNNIRNGVIISFFTSILFYNRHTLIRVGNHVLTYFIGNSEENLTNIIQSFRQPTINTNNNNNTFDELLRQVLEILQEFFY